jgi:SAM-dependent methyltransferase
MRAWAKQATREPSVRYVAASAYETGLPDACADVVTAAQSLQWMQPQRVFPEIARILRPGGVFCAYQYEALQTPLWQPEGEWERVMRRKRELRIQLGLDAGRRRWPITSARLRPMSGVTAGGIPMGIPRAEKGRLAGCLEPSTAHRLNQAGLRQKKTPLPGPSTRSAIQPAASARDRTDGSSRGPRPRSPARAEPPVADA